MTDNTIINQELPSRKTLVICPIGLGNFILATPAMELLCRELGVENLHILALKPGIRLMAEESGWFGKIHFWDPDREALFRGIQLLKKLRRCHFNFSISLFPSAHWKFCLFAWLTAARKKIGFAYNHTPIPSWIQDHSFSIDMSAHDSEQNLSLAQSILGLALNPPKRLIFPVTIRSTQESSLLNQAYFVCHPGSSPERGMLQKRLPANKFALLIDRIHKSFGLKCLLLGGLEERPLRESIMVQAPEAFLDYESQDLHEVGAFIKHAKFFLGNDSGMMHFAVALNKKCIAFFGPSDETRTGPYYLTDDLKRQKSSLSRGHLIIRHQERIASDREISSVNPRLRIPDSDGLQKLDAEKAWEKIESFIQKLF
jgi:ADP-heptose:LPS heptosyltransferase